METKSNKGLPCSRRFFLKGLGAAGLSGALATLSGCKDAGKPSGGEGWTPQQYNAPGSWPVQVRGRVPIDPANPSIVRDDRKCILCGQCAEACERVQSVEGFYGLPIKNDITCVNCGQCALWCPTGAIGERDDIARVLRVIGDAKLHVIVQTAPATRIAIGEEFGMPAGSIVEGKMVAALKLLGFDRVFDTNFSADLTIMEEGTELIGRIKAAGGQHESEDHGHAPTALPQFTSCSPGWVKFCEYFYPDLLEHMSTCKSPQQMLGSVAKTYYAKKKGIDPKQIVSVSIMPCTAKKFEAARGEMNSAGALAGNPELRDVNFVLTTRELARMIKRKGIDLANLAPQPYDSLMGEGTGAAVIFAATGGVMEAAVRSGYYLLTGQNPPDALLNLTAVRGLQGVKEASLEVPGFGELRVAVASGLGNARQLLDQIRADKQAGLPPRYHFVEFMACPGGCISGGGQPKTSVPPGDWVRKERIRSIYAIDATIYKKRLSHENKEVLDLYAEYLGQPNGELAHRLLHTTYTDRSGSLTAKNKA
ncbi:MAG: [FeFe] hydrogenase, group A [Desulfobulbus sp.]|uniref:[FeFe] hydrogenase, group A n=1 Tax=Desulfobulbus sp. TaxID=895 RepID=UPI00284AF5D7|nr:[FeFe] hydrogenase, group A [Desulfobulbus sp.]MDR2551312.1 [FeFe] hydrogenase, group A [Desulfobulbus sp.]